MPPNAAQQPILVVDDDRGLVRLIEKALQREGFSTAHAGSGQDALEWLERHRAALMLLDLKLQDIEGKDLVDRLSQTSHCPPFIIITGQGDERAAVEMMKRGARDYLVKDVDFLQFVPAVVKRALAQLENERRLAEAEDQVRLVRSVIEQGFSAVLITDGDLPDPRIVYINPAFAQASGYAQDKVVGRPLSSLAGLHTVSQRLRAGLPKGASSLDEISTYQAAEGERWGEWRVGPVKDKTGKNSHWLVIFRDITERKRLEKEILEISDRERLRLGQDLHDGLCQHLAGIELMSQVLQQKLAPKSSTAAARVGDIARHVRDAIAQTRALARGLSPVTLESEGLTSALQELAANTEKMFGLACRVECPRPVEIRGPAVATHLYRIAQEAVSNAIKHGQAAEVVIRLESARGRTRLSITDNGRGFPKTPPKQPGMGLHIMQYRAGLIGGSLALQKNPAGGTIVVCTVPASTQS
ncbi:MAG TPA: response regulator [Candidatus Binatia bacterium]|jgi:PAS domain S-box-containing protein|nr:response regulator [Candidatus Binatia bacterium]